MRRLNRTPQGAMFIVVSAIALLVSAAAAPVAAEETGASGDCVVPDSTGLTKTATMTAAGYHDYEQWIAEDAAQGAMSTLQNKLNRRFAENTKWSPDRQLAAGLIGLALDDVAKQVVVVVDPALVDAGQLAAGLRAFDSGPLDVRVQAGCHSAADLLAVAQTIRSRDWHPRAATASYAGSLNPRTSRHEYTFPPQFRDVGEALVAKLGDWVAVDYGPAGPADRADDGLPHWGGAGIGPRGGGNICTSGFTVDTRTAGKAMVTAGHCFNNGQQVESGDEAYGVAQGETAFPIFDMMLINASNQNYDDDVYHNPFVPENSPIDVRGGANATTGAVICVSGMVSLAECGNRVVGFNGVVCHPGGGCTTGLMETTRATGTPCTFGDSGAPMYQGNPATIRGLFTGFRQRNCMGETVAAVQAHLGVRVATSP